eukprot:gene9988-biopygen10208
MLLDRGGIQATSLQPYLSAINNYHEDIGWPGPAKGRSVSRAVKGMTRLQVAASEATGVIVTERTWLPAKHVRTVHDAALTLEPEDQDQIRWLQACTYVMLAFVSFGRPATGTSLQQENVLMDEDGVTVVLNREKGKNHKLKKRQLSIPWWGVERLRESSGHGARMRPGAVHHRGGPHQSVCRAASGGSRETERAHQDQTRTWAMSGSSGRWAVWAVCLQRAGTFQRTAPGRVQQPVPVLWGW